LKWRQQDKTAINTWFVLHNYCTPKKLDVISISHASRWVVTEYALTALYLKMYTPSKLSVCFNLNLNSYVIIQWTAIILLAKMCRDWSSVARWNATFSDSIHHILFLWEYKHPFIDLLPTTNFVHDLLFLDLFWSFIILLK
jgi:hypothetical protein